MKRPSVKFVTKRGFVTGPMPPKTYSEARDHCLTLMTDFSEFTDRDDLARLWLDQNRQLLSHLLVDGKHNFQATVQKVLRAQAPALARRIAQLILDEVLHSPSAKSQSSRSYSKQPAWLGEVPGQN